MEDNEYNPDQGCFNCGCLLLIGVVILCYLVFRFIWSL